MNPNLTAEIWSFIYILLVSGIAFMMHSRKHLDSEKTRKFIHILVSFWAFILVYAYDDFWWAISGPIVFIFVNAAFGIFGFGKSLMGMKDKKRDIGLVCYPLSILILTILLYMDKIDGRIVIASILIMGLGDGLAAVVGSTWGEKRYHAPGGEKSIEGSLVMFIVSFLICFIFTPIAWWGALIVGVAAMVLEMLGPSGFDNLTVPLATALLMAALF